jgi:hypothetical protein
MNPNPRAIVTGALLAAGTAGIQAVITALGAGPAGIITSIAALLTTAITVLGPKLIDLRAEQQFSKDIRWLITHKQGDIREIATQLKEYHEQVLQTRVAAIKAARTKTKERKTGKGTPFPSRHLLARARLRMRAALARWTGPGRQPSGPAPAPEAAHAFGSSAACPQIWRRRVTRGGVVGH